MKLKKALGRAAWVAFVSASLAAEVMWVAALSAGALAVLKMSMTYLVG